MNRVYRNQKLSPNIFSIDNLMAIFICITIILTGVGIYLHFSNILSMNNLWGIYPLILSLPGLFLYGFNIFYLLIAGLGVFHLTLANIPNIPLAIMIALITIGIIGLVAYIIKKIKK